MFVLYKIKDALILATSRMLCVLFDASNANYLCLFYNAIVFLIVIDFTKVHIVCHCILVKKQTLIALPLMMSTCCYAICVLGVGW